MRFKYTIDRWPIHKIGFGYDSHAFCEDKDTLVLGGYQIQHRGLDGISDADVVVHSIVDAILSCVGRTNIGDTFKEDDLANKGRNSMEFIDHCRSMLNDRNLAIQNIECTVICDSPRVSQYADAMCMNIANRFGIAKQAIYIKGKTTEGINGVNGIVCYTIICLRRRIKKSVIIVYFILLYLFIFLLTFSCLRLST